MLFLCIDRLFQEVLLSVVAVVVVVVAVTVVVLVLVEERQEEEEHGGGGGARGSRSGGRAVAPSSKQKPRTQADSSLRAVERWSIGDEACQVVLQRNVAVFELSPPNSLTTCSQTADSSA